MRYLRTATALLVLCGVSLATGGCGSAPRNGAVPRPTAETTAAATSTLPPETTTTTLTPLPDTTGTDFSVVVRNLDLLLNLAYERVDLSLLDLIYTPDAENRKTAEEQLRYLLANGWHYDGADRSKVTDITAQTPLGGVAIVDLTSSKGPQVVKDAGGQVVKTGEGWTPRRERYGLFRGVDGRWRIRDSSLLGPA